MKEADDELQLKLQNLNKKGGILLGPKSDADKVIKAMDGVVQTAAWLHHIITFIHPFREGNGRTARLAANLILERYGLIGISIKVEKENKNRYRRALAQIDAAADYVPLVDLIYDGLLERYDGAALRYYAVKGK